MPYYRSQCHANRCHDPCYDPCWNPCVQVVSKPPQLPVKLLGSTAVDGTTATPSATNGFSVRVASPTQGVYIVTVPSNLGKSAFATLSGVTVGTPAGPGVGMVALNNGEFYVTVFDYTLGQNGLGKFTLDVFGTA